MLKNNSITHLRVKYLLKIQGFGIKNYLSNTNKWYILLCAEL